MNQFMVGLERTCVNESNDNHSYNLSDGQRADLARRVGKGLKKLSSLGAAQIANVLDRLFGVRFIQSYILWRSSNTIAKRYSQADPAPYTIIPIFSLRVVLKGSDYHEVGPDALENVRLGELAQRIGEDFELIRSLDAVEIIDVLNRAYRVGYLDGFEIIPGEKARDSNLGIDGSEDPLLEDLDEISSRATKWPLGVNFEWDNGQLAHQDNSTPAVDHGGGFEVLRTRSTTIMSRSTSDVAGNTPTPLRGDLDGQWQKKKQQTPSSPIRRHGKPDHYLARSAPNIPKSRGVVIAPNVAAERLLKGCKFGKQKVSLDDGQLRKVLKAATHLLPCDAAGILRPLLDHWRDNWSHDRHPLGLPTGWIGLGAAVNYIRTLDSHEGLDHIAERVAYLLLYLNYQQLRAHPEKYCPRSRAPRERKETYILNCILDSYYDDPKLSSDHRARRNRITGIFMRKGAWWWKLASSLGVGILLVGDDKLMSEMYNNTFTAPEVDALITYISYCRQGTIRLFHSLESIVKPLMFGQLPTFSTIRDDESGLRGQLWTALAEDETALASQTIKAQWYTIDTDHNALKRIPDFLC